MAFKGISDQGPPPDSPGALYRDLPRRQGAVPGVWHHQGEIFRLYAQSYADVPDLALELPTGTGKTLTGLVVLDWVRRVRRARVVYACPTVQLVGQVAATAGREGVPVSVLTGGHADWDEAAKAGYDAAEAVAITTYSTIFNSHPKLATADTLLFDDAHAGEQYIGQQYSFTVDRRSQPATYADLLSAIEPALDQMLVQRLRDDVPDAGVQGQVRMVFPLRQPGMVAALDKVLAALGRPDSFRYSMIRAAMNSCHVFATYGSITVRPLIPPTSDNPLFSAARQRLYLSATLGGGGELERAFGRAGVQKLPLPDDTPTPRSGRRFFVFPDLVDGDPHELSKQIVAATGKALVLAPSKELAVASATSLSQAGWPILTAADVADGMQPFIALNNATCGLASRYDGLDLPADACRCVVLEGKPDQDSLQERFLSTKVRAGAALAERIRTRVVQGVGRCTRGPDDWAVVIVRGSELTSYLMRPETLDALEPELQAEVRFGIENSRKAVPAEVLDNVRVFLAQDDEWLANAEPLLVKMRHDALRVLPPGTDALADAADLEVEACALAAASRWMEASQQAQEAARRLGAGGDSTRGYRALWLYLAGQWLDQAAAESEAAADHRAARALIRQAELAAKPATWTRELAPLPGLERESLSSADALAVRKIASLVHAGVNRTAHDAATERMDLGLAATEPSAYEPALTTLGKLLGAEASKPAGNGRCDSTWCWDDALWLAIEAKSKHEPTGLVPHKDIRQANDQLTLLAADRGQPTSPIGSATVIVSPKPAIHPDGILSALPEVHRVWPGTVSDLGSDVTAAWAQILSRKAGRSGNDLQQLVAEVLANHGTLPSQVLERLTQDPVGGEQVPVQP